MSRRVFEVAKDLGVAAKAVVAKCHAEGIPESIVKNHMSTVSAGLEATIREWFSEESSGTAVETAERVDLKKVRAKARPRRAASGKEPAEESPPAEVSESTTAVAEPPPARAKTKARAPAPAPAGDDDDEAPRAEPERPREVAAPAARAPEPEPPQRDEDRDEPEPEGEDEPSVRAAPMNVPARPKSVKPAGPRLETQAPVRLSGPRIVRVEAPEVVSTPKPRRASGEGGARAPAGPAPGGPATGDDDRGRSPRRGASKRRAGPAPHGVPERRRGAAGERDDWKGNVYSEQDMLEREARLLRSGGFVKKRRQDLSRSQTGSSERLMTPAETGGVVRITAPFTIKDLSATTGVKAADIVKKLFMHGIMASINSGIDTERAQEIMLDYNIELEVTEQKTAEQAVSEEFERRDRRDPRPRAPVVTILGHVDHGKTSLLDRIRKTNVAAGEAGGITQATSAFRVPLRIGEEEKFIVFIDTPGHEAFTAMRARGASVTDIVVLVIAADDGVMPQTIESISHAKAAGVPMVIALNKIDKPEVTDARIQQIYAELARHGVDTVPWGGTTEVVRTSATTGTGIQELLEVLDLQAQVLELTADFAGAAIGTIIESRVVEGRGAVANVLLQEGQLAVGDFVVAGRAFGRVRDITDDRGSRLTDSSPPMPVQISGLDEIPDAGDRFYVVDSLKKAQHAAEQRRAREREAQLAQPKVTLDSLFSQMDEADMKEILVVLKADVQGSVDVLRAEIEKITTSEVKVRVLHAAVGGITESDVVLADASRAVIIGFNVIASAKARHLAEQKGVEIRSYQVIYHIADDLRKAAEGLLEPELRQEVLGHAEVRQVFKVSRVGAIAGCYVTDGVVQRDALIRVTRSDIIIENDRKLSQLKRFKDDVKEVRAGMECGMKIDGYDDIKEGDILECYKQVEVRRSL